MRRTQVQLPDELYDALKRLVEHKEWSLSEALRQGAEYVIRINPLPDPGNEQWLPPEPLNLGEALAPFDSWREMANTLDEGD